MSNIKKILILQITYFFIKFARAAFDWIVFVRAVFVGDVTVTDVTLLKQFFYNYITNKTFQVFTIFASTCTMIPNIYLIYLVKHWCFIWFLHSHRNLFLFSFWSDLHFLPSNLHLHSHDMFFLCFRFIYSCYHIKDT